jgi:DTW domain-containing protein YfiP
VKEHTVTKHSKCLSDNGNKDKKTKNLSNTKLPQNHKIKTKPNMISIDQMPQYDTKTVFPESYKIQ